MSRTFQPQLVFNPGPGGGSAPLLGTRGQAATVYRDAAGAIVEADLSVGGIPAADGRIVVSATSRTPELTVGGTTPATTLYVKPDGSTVVTPIFAAAEQIFAELSVLLDEAAAIAGHRSILEFPGNPDVDATPMLTAALAVADLVVLPYRATGYTFASALGTIPARKTIRGAGKTSTLLKKAFNGNFATMGEGSAFEDLTLDLQGATFTGRGLLFSGTDGRQRLNKCRVINGDGFCLEFEVGAGSQFQAHQLTASRVNGGTGTGRYAIKISDTQQLSAVPRSFVQLETDGQCAIDFGGCNNTYVTSSTVGDLRFTGESRNVNILGGRWLNQAAATVDGHGVSVVGCDVAPQLTIAANADAITLGPGQFNQLPIIDNSGNDRNNIHHAEIVYTPTLTSTGTAPSLGNGTLIGRYSRHGAAVTVALKLTIGSTTTLGTGNLLLGLPVKRVNTTTYGGMATIFDVSAGIFYNAALQYQSASDKVALIRDTSGGVSGTSPVALAVGDTIDFTATYQL